MILVQVLVASTLFVLILSKPPHHDGDEDHNGHPYPERPAEGVALFAESLKMEIPNYFILNFDDFSDDEASSDGNAVLEGIWCQSGYSDNTTGIWYRPDHTSVPLYTEPFGHDHNCDHHMHKDIVAHPEKNCYSNHDPSIFSAQFVGQTVLLRDRDSHESLTEDDGGLFYCMIANEILVVGIYTATSNTNTGPVTTEISVDIMDSESIDGSEAVLMFNVSNGPPTHIRCTGPSGWFIYETSDQLTRAVIDRDTTSISIVLRQLEVLEGAIQCNVSNIRAYDVTTSINIKSEDSLSVVRLGNDLALYEVSWTGLHTLYHIYYSIPELNISNMALGSTSNNNLTANLSHIVTSNTIAFGDGRSYSVLFYVLGSDGTTINSTNSIGSTIAAIDQPSITNISSSTNAISIQLMWSIKPSNGYTVVTNCWTLCDSNSLNTSQQSSNASSRVVVITQLAPGMACTVSVHGHYGNNDDIVFALSETFQTVYVVPSLPPSNIEVVSVYSYSIMIQWDTVPCHGQNGPILGYYIQYTPTPTTTITRRSTVSHSTAIITTLNTNESMVTLSDLSPYTNYSVTVTPYNSAGNGTQSEQLLIQTNESVPESVFGIVITPLSDTSVIVSWNEPLINNGPITSYDVHLNHTRDNNTYSHMISTHDKMVEVHGLPLHSVKYTISVRAHTSVGPGEWVSMDYIKLPEVQNVSLSMSMNDSTMLHLSWSPVIDDNLLRIIVQLSLFPYEHIYEIKLSRDSTSLVLPQLIYGNITIFGVYLIDNELYNSAVTVVQYEYDMPSHVTSCLPTPIVTGLDEGLNVSKESSNLSGVFIVIIVVLCITLAIAILVIVVLVIISRRKLKQAEQELAAERMNSFENKRKPSSKDDTYVKMSSSTDILLPQYENLPSQSISDVKSTDGECCDGEGTDASVVAVTPDGHQDTQHEHEYDNLGQDFSQSGVYESVF